MEMQSSSKKVIIVDDDTDLLDMLTFSFEAEGFEVKGISNGTEALAYLSDANNLQGACLLILDRLLQDMDGLDLLKKVGKTFPRHLPILILSVLSSERDVLAGLKSGAIDYMAKPFSLPVLVSKALALIEREKNV